MKLALALGLLLPTGLLAGLTLTVAYVLRGIMQDWDEDDDWDDLAAP